MQVAAYLQFMLLCIFILGMILFHAVHGVSRGRDWRLFIGAIIGALFCQIFDLLWGLIDLGTITVSVPLHIFICSLYYSSVTALALWWLYYSEYSLESSLMKTRRGIALYALPYLLMIILLMISAKTGCIFYIDENNVYQRGDLYLLSTLITYSYLIFSSVRALMKAFNKNNYARKRDYLVLASFPVFPCLMGVAQYFTPAISMIGMGITLAVTQIYLVSQETLISIDPLTRLNNRNQLLKYLSGKMKNYSGRARLYLLIMDVDNFKTINDKLGHVEGDNALIQIANTLKLHCAKKDYFASRYGGDEFIMVCEAESEEEIDALCDSIEKELASHSISLSIGYALYTEDIKNIPDFIAKADRNLYRIKRERQSRVG